MTVIQARKPHRTPEQQIADLQAKIASIEARAERKRARENPAVRLTVNAVKLLDKALNATQDAVARKTIEEARQGLGAYVATQGWAVPTAGAATEAPVKPGGKQRVA